ncbi:MAG: stage II sporulation protein R [Oscillospiraceae bacterium]|nr:stage II sporulation protein R [Oscillospiraceae bacterium]
MKKIELAVIIGVAISLLTFNLGAFAKECDQIRSSVLRLHVLANSDSKEDQELKEEVRDRILSDTRGMFDNAEDLGDAGRQAQQAIDAVRKTAEELLAEKGIDYSVEVGMTNMYFPTRTYDNLTFPAGNYDALRVTIGSGSGQNWWCVLYPPLCVPASSSRKSISDVLSSEQDKIVKSNPKYEVRFAIVEWWQRIGRR